MIVHLKGHLQRKTPHAVVVDNAGIGYEVIVPLSTFYALPEEEEKVSLHIYTHVREDAFVLFGFHRPLEKEIFMMLISVSGIGPKLAINILSGIGPEELLDAMAVGDAARMQSIPGVGKKTAERIALELRDKALHIRNGREPFPSPALPDEDRRTHEDAVSALINLGYSAKLARAAVDKARRVVEEPSLEALIKEALRILV